MGGRSELHPADRPLSSYAEQIPWRFKEFHNNPQMKRVLPSLKRFFSDVVNHRQQSDVTPYWLTILGPSGVGKTLALRQLFKVLERNDHLWPIPIGSGGSERLAQCAHIVPGQDLTDFKAPKDYGDYDLIYVEDIGTGNQKGAAQVTFERTMELLLYRPAKWTLIDANLSLGELNEAEPRLASRMLRDGSILIEIPASVPDFNSRR